MDATSTRKVSLINTPFSLKKKDNSVGSVGIFGNFLLGDLWGLFRFAYTAYTTYTIILLL